jgi:hypothetical protein
LARPAIEGISPLRDQAVAHKSTNLGGSCLLNLQLPST